MTGYGKPLNRKTFPNIFSSTSTRRYILEKLKSAGCNQSVFEDNAVEAVLNAADGIPRMISKLCNACLLIGDSAKSDTITSDIVMKSVNDSEL